MTQTHINPHFSIFEIRMTYSSLLMFGCRTPLGLFAVAVAMDSLADAWWTAAAALQWCDEPERDKREKRGDN